MAPRPDAKEVYSQIQTSVHTGVAQGTLGEILQKDHIPQIETLFRLADHFGTDRINGIYLHLIPIAQ